MRIALAVFALVALIAPQRPALVVGSPAPPIAVERWMQGEPASVAPGKIVVLEFWATWCGPCIEAMPHLSSLAEQYKGKVAFVGVDVSDRKVLPDEKLPNSQSHIDRIRKWMDDNAGKMRYSVALDDAADTMDKTWLKAAGKNTIPSTFVVSDQKVVWIGLPTDLENPLFEIVAGTYDLRAGIAKYEAELDLAAKAAALRALAAKGDVDGVEQAFKEFKAINPKGGVDQIVPVVHALAAANPATAAPFLTRRVADTYDDPTFLVMISYAVAFKAENAMDAYKSLVEFSAKHVTRVPVTSAAISYAYHALMQFKVGNTAAAREWILKAERFVDQHEPLRTRENIRGFVKDAKAKISGLLF
jgi:thiol-disulfide isomerase/thioredoxin